MRVTSNTRAEQHADSGLTLITLWFGLFLKSKALRSLSRSKALLPQGTCLALATYDITGPAYFCDDLSKVRANFSDPSSAIFLSIASAVAASTSKSGGGAGSGG